MTKIETGKPSRARRVRRSGPDKIDPNVFRDTELIKWDIGKINRTLTKTLLPRLRWNPHDIVSGRDLPSPIIEFYEDVINSGRIRSGMEKLPPDHQLSLKESVIVSNYLINILFMRPEIGTLRNMRGLLCKLKV